ncbi:MAG: D-alanine:D-lactate ligase-like protein [Rhizobiaceae bacterium]|nr:D-alanine:D-lactate ligase-like protein [Rhizobiaceae bacterium]
MMPLRSELLLVYEPEAVCRAGLAAEGFSQRAIVEISSYLAQSTDIAPEFPQIVTQCERRGIAFRPVELDDAAAVLPTADPARTLVWTLTDGITYFRGSAAPGLARLNGLRTLGADDATFALCQDKFRSGAVLAALGAPVPAAGLARDGRWVVMPPAAPGGWFVKPNRLGAKIGIWPDSRCATEAQALELSRRIFAAYRDDAIVQAYVPGRNVRASLLDVTGREGVGALEAWSVDSGADFQTMEDSLALYGETGAAAAATGTQNEPALTPVPADTLAAIRSIAQRLCDGLGLRDVFSMDLRVEESGRLHLIEFEVCPGLPCFDFRAYLKGRWGMDLATAMAATAATRLT